MTGIYIHIPFCIKKCDYCDFVSYPQAYSYENEYVNAVCKEMHSYEKEKTDTLYIGGGTPTSLNCNSLLRIINSAYECFDIDSKSEITVECNPKTADYEYFKALRRAGVNRLSIGVQTLDDNELKMLGRIHTKNDSIECVNMAKEAGFENISLDVMFAVPNQTKKSFLNTLDGVIELKPQHISCYGLIIEENTLFFELEHSGKLKRANEDEEIDFYKTAIKVLAENGYDMYEISNFAKKGYRSRHNSKYWNLTSYIGIGAAAHSYYKGFRYENTADLKKYISGEAVQKKCFIDREGSISEFMILGLRQTEGVSEKVFFDRYKENLYDKFKSIIDKYVNLGLMERKDGFVRLSVDGLLVSNSVMCEFM